MLFQCYHLLAEPNIAHCYAISNATCNSTIRHKTRGKTRTIYFSYEVYQVIKVHLVYTCLCVTGIQLQHNF